MRPNPATAVERVVADQHQWGGFSNKGPVIDLRYCPRTEMWIPIKSPALEGCTQTPLLGNLMQQRSFHNIFLPGNRITAGRALLLPQGCGRRYPLVLSEAFTNCQSWGWKGHMDSMVQGELPLAPWLNNLSQSQYGGRGFPIPSLRDQVGSNLFSFGSQESVTRCAITGEVLLNFQSTGLGRFGGLGASLLEPALPVSIRVSGESIGLVFGKGIQAQGMPAEAFVMRVVGTEWQLPPGHMTLDAFHRPTGTGISVKSLNTQTPSMLKYPRRCFYPLKRAVDQLHNYPVGRLKNWEVLSELINSKEVWLTVPQATTPAQWLELERARQYGKARDIDVYFIEVAYKQ